MTTADGSAELAECSAGVDLAAPTGKFVSRRS
jgi:hypothetical protein